MAEDASPDGRSDDGADWDDLDLLPETAAISHNALPAQLEAWRRRTVTGAVLTGLVRGFGQVFEPEREQPAIVAEAPGEPPGPPRPVEALLDPDDPRASILFVRGWLIDD